MSEKMDIEISEFLDGELDENRFSPFVSRCNGNDESKRKLARYAVVRDCMRRSGAGSAPPDFADRLMSALADEPVVLAPRRRIAFDGERARRVLKPAAGLAVAASVATMAVLGLRGDNATAPEQAVPPAAQSQQLAADAVQTQPRTPNMQYADAQVRRPVVQAASASDRAWLNDYLLRHNEATGFVGRSGFMPYVHIVTTERATGENGDREFQIRRMPVNDTQPE